VGIIFVLLPISLTLAIFGLLSYIWCVKSGQFEDLNGPAVRMLFDDDELSLEAFAKVISDNSQHEGVLIVDRSKRIVYADKKTCEILNRQQSELLGKSCNELNGLFPCTEEACTLTNDCRLFALPRDAEQIRCNGSAEFASRVLRTPEGLPLGSVHVITLNEQLEELTQPSVANQFQGIIGASPLMTKVFQLIELVAKTDVTVHISGESGTGKELVAEAIHKLSSRSEKRLVKVNCSTIPVGLLESALFGHVKGSFTGAHKDNRGFVEYAEGGTLFLDEIGDVSLDIQVKLLRLLQAREYQRVGESQSRIANIRIVTATNHDLFSLVKQGKVREDFYYRINVFPIDIPPLRDRRSDVKLLADHFILSFNFRFGKSINGLSTQALEALMNYPWPGNVRELEHAIEHSFVKVLTGLIQIDHLPPSVIKQTLSKDNSINTIKYYDEESRIRSTLLETGGNLTKASKLLGYSRVTLWKKMKGMGIERAEC
jgi:two-component system response regulator HydG